MMLRILTQEAQSLSKVTIFNDSVEHLREGEEVGRGEDRGREREIERERREERGEQTTR